MSTAPSPHSVSPSTRCPSRPRAARCRDARRARTRCARPSSVRATTVSPRRSHREVRAAGELPPRRGRPAPPRRGSPTGCRRARPSAPGGRSPRHAGAGATTRHLVVAQRGLELRLVVALPRIETLDHQHAREEELPAGVLARRDALARRRSTAAPPPGRAPRRCRRRSRGSTELRIVPSPSTAPSPTRAPWVTIERLPIMASSPTMTGAAFGGSSTPPMPTPPDRCTRAPICAHDPTVAQVSTMVSAPTRAPMFT